MAGNPIRFDEQFTLDQLREARVAFLGEGAAGSVPRRAPSLKTRCACWTAGLAALSGVVLLLGGAPVAGRAITAHEHAIPDKPVPVPPAPTWKGATIVPAYRLTSEQAHRLPLSEQAPTF